MSGGFRIVLILVAVIALLFAGFSLWPLYRQMQSQPASQPATPAPAPASSTSTAAPAATAPLSPAPTPPITYATRQPKEEKPETTWLYTQHSAILRVTPGGHSYRAASVSSAPLTILVGTRLYAQKTEGEWVMVKSPSGLLGWLHESEVGTNIPYYDRTRF